MRRYETNFQTEALGKKKLNLKLNNFMHRYMNLTSTLVECLSLADVADVA